MRRMQLVSYIPSSSLCNDTFLIALPDETPELDDADDLLLDVQKVVKEHQLRCPPKPDEGLPTPLSAKDIVQEQKLYDFCQPVNKTQLSRKDPLYFEEENGMLCRTTPWVKL